MEILAILIPLSLILVVLWVVVYVWSVRNGQFDDLEHEATKILFEDSVMTEPEEKDTAEHP